MQDTQLDKLQRMIASLVARGAAGVGLCLIGGFRYRLLDDSPRVSNDIDYHCEGDLESIRHRLLLFFTRELLPTIKRRFGYDGDARAVDKPGDESDTVKVLELAFYRLGTTEPRIEIPVECTRVICMDKPVSRTKNGTVFLTTSDQDTIENKVIALLNRTFVQARDFLDIYFFADALGPDSPSRVRAKLELLHVSPASVLARLDDFTESRDYYTKAIGAVMTEQVESATRSTIELGGGAASVLVSVTSVLDDRLKLKGRAR